MLAILMSGGDLTFMLVATLIIGFLAGACWMSLGRKNKQAEGDTEKKYADIIDLNEALESKNYDWRKGVNN